MARPITRDFLAGKKKPLTKTVTVVLDPDLAEEYEQLRQQRDMAHARTQVQPDNPEGHAQLLEADAALEACKVRLEEEDAVAYFTFRGIGRAAYEKLVDSHPPTAEQRTKAKAGGMGDLAWNHDTLPPALVAACLVEPQLSYEDVLDLWCSPDWNQAELAVLLNTAIEVNGSRRTVDLGKDFRPTHNSAARSRTA